MIEIVVTTVTILAGVVTLLSYFSKEKVRVTVIPEKEPVEVLRC